MNRSYVIKIIAGAIVGALVAVQTDLDAYLAWKKAHSADQPTWDWSVAIVRAIKGGIGGGLAGAGLGAIA